MSTFDGLIREFPTIAIDNFRVRPGVKVYLLSHIHSDHLSGLAAQTWDSPIYCSPITARWLPMLATRSKQMAFETGKDRRPLMTDVAHYLDLGNGRRARVSLIPAHHCPGAVMFLIQDDRSCILYTGDARNEATDLQGLRTMPIFSSSIQSIDRLYLDTTCCHPAFEKFPTRDQAISDLIIFINRRPRLAHYYIDAWTFGYEDVWIGLSKAFNTKIHVSPYLYELYEAIDDIISPRILPHLTTEGSTARFHSCHLDKTCGYGGAGGEHAGSRMLIRIQPNVSWFSPMLRRERQDAGENDIIAQGTVTGRNNIYKIKERLPPCISKRDDLFYYFHYGCHASLSELQQLVELVSPRALFPCVLHRDAITHTFFRSNQEIIALLAPYMPQQFRINLSVEEYRDREPLLIDGVTTDFQSFHHVKGYHVLDMNDNVRGITSNEVRSIKRNRNDVFAFTTPMQDHVALSPRSRHLRRKMNKLKRQLRNTASLEEEDGVESSIDEGPLSIDLAIVEKKRKRQLSSDKGQTTTQETTREYSELHSRSTVIHSGDISSRIRMNSITECVNDVLREDRGQECEIKPWYDQSTMELDQVTFLDPYNEIEAEAQIETEDDERSQIRDISIDRWVDISTDRSRVEPITPEGYVTSSPDSIFGSLGFSDNSPDAISFTPKSKPIEEEDGKIKSISPSSKESAILSLFAPAVAAAVSEDDASGDTLTHCLRLLLPSLPKTPPRITAHNQGVILGESPSKMHDNQPFRRRSLSPSVARQYRRHQQLMSRTDMNISEIEEPRGNIFAQVVWSPPRKRGSRLRGPPTDLQNTRLVPRGQIWETTVTPSEVIVISSSDE
ncbi:hypothetical protein FBU30_003611, partial [Linnemannia zychae]